MRVRTIDLGRKSDDNEVKRLPQESRSGARRRTRISDIINCEQLLSPAAHGKKKETEKSVYFQEQTRTDLIIDISGTNSNFTDTRSHRVCVLDEA